MTRYYYQSRYASLAGIDSPYRDREIPWSSKLITAPTEEPITLADAKLHMRVDFDIDDPLIESYITASRQWAELGFTKRAFVTQTWDFYLDAFPVGTIIEVPYPPLQSVTEIVYTDENGTDTTFPPSQYVVDTISEPGRISLAANVYCWPTVCLQPINGVRIRFVAGYGAAKDVPRQIRNALLLLVADLYEHRENSVIGSGINITDVSFSVQSLLTPLRIFTY